MLDLAVDGAAVEVAELHAVRRENGHVAIGEEEHVARVAEDGGNVGRDEVFAFAEADHDGRAFAGGDDLVGIVAVEDGKREYAAELLHGAADRAFQIAFEIFFDEMRDDFGVGFGLEGVAFLLQLLFQRKEVFHDAVVNDDDIAGAVAVRMGVLFAGAAVRGPAGVADAVVAFDGIEAEHVFEIAEFARCAADTEGFVVTVDGETRRIIPAVFEPFQAVHDDGDGALGAYITHDSAHDFIVRNEGLARLIAPLIPALG